MNKIPDGWIEIKLGDLCKMTSGGTPSRKNPSFYIGDIPWVKSGELDYNVITETEEHISEEALKNSSAKVFPKGTLLIALYGATIGKLAFLGIDAATNQAVCGIFQNPAFSSKFLFYKLFFERPKLVEKGIGGAQPNISQTILKDTDVFLSPLPEQHRIVAKIEELFSELDNGIANLEKAKAQLKVYRQAVLKSAFEGKLTEQWRTGQLAKGALPSAEDLLARIQEERQNHYEQQLTEWREAVAEWEANGKEGRKPSKPKKLKEYPPLTEKELGELPELPVGWQWVKLGKISNNIQTGPFGSQLHKEDYVEEGIPLINPKHIKDQRIYPDWSVSITDEKLQDLPQYILTTEDIIMGRRGEMGRSAPITEKEKGWFCGTGSLFIRLTKFSVPTFYSLFISGRRTKKYLEDNSIGTTMKNLNSSVLINTPIILVSLEEQHQIVQEIESRLSVCDHMEQEIETALQKSEALRQSILKKAFEGRLVPQDPAEEPAEVLLERIKAEKSQIRTHGQV